MSVDLHSRVVSLEEAVSVWLSARPEVQAPDARGLLWAALKDGRLSAAGEVAYRSFHVVSNNLNPGAGQGPFVPNEWLDEVPPQYWDDPPDFENNATACFLLPSGMRRPWDCRVQKIRLRRGDVQCVARGETVPPREQQPVPADSGESSHGSDPPQPAGETGVSDAVAEWAVDVACAFALQGLSAPEEKKGKPFARALAEVYRLATGRRASFGTIETSLRPVLAAWRSVEPQSPEARVNAMKDASTADKQKRSAAQRARLIP